MSKQESNKKYRENNKDKIAEYNKQYYKNNPDKFENIKRDPEKAKEYVKKYRIKRKLEKLKAEDVKFLEFVKGLEKWRKK